MKIRSQYHIRFFSSARIAAVSKLAMFSLVKVEAKYAKSVRTRKREATVVTCGVDLRLLVADNVSNVSTISEGSDEQRAAGSKTKLKYIILANSIDSSNVGLWAHSNCTV